MLNVIAKNMPQPLVSISTSQAKAINWLFTDVDDTLTWEGVLPLESMVALTKLAEAGVRVVPVTGACAGWCDQLLLTSWYTCFIKKHNHEACA